MLLYTYIFQKVEKVDDLQRSPSRAIAIDEIKRNPIPKYQAQMVNTGEFHMNCKGQAVLIAPQPCTERAQKLWLLETVNTPSAQT